MPLREEPMPAKEEKIPRRKSKSFSGEGKVKGRKPAKSKAAKRALEAAVQEDGFLIVGVGASAGGIRALEGLLGRMPAGIPFSLVVVQHLDPKRESVVPNILSRTTAVPVRKIQDSEKIEPGRIYVKPPDKDLLIIDRCFSLKEPEKTGHVRLPIDLFFRSLAEDIGDKAVGLILSGTGSDGTQGAKEIKGAGGLVIAQDENQAEHGGMPRSAVDAGAVDMVLPVEQMADHLLQYAAHPLLTRADLEEERSESLRQSNTQKILNMVRLRTGHDFSMYKPNTVRRRIARRMAVNRIESLHEYTRFISEGSDEAEELFKDLVVNVTSFFRNPQVFQKLEKVVISEILSRKKMESMIRIWVPGCATGEEPYSLAMLFQEAMERERIYLKLKIFATDISPDAIEKAREGLFSSNIAIDVKPERLNRFFEKNDDQTYKIKSSLRELIVFSVHDITRDAPLVRMDLVSCRNVLIYMNAELQRKVLPVFHYSLNPGAVLVLGTSEGVGDFHDLFDAIDRRNKIFRKKGDELRYWSQITSFSRREQTAGNGAAARPVERGKSSEAEIPFNRAVLDEALSELEKSGVIVDEGNNVVYFVGDTSPFLSQPSGKPTLNVIRMAATGIRQRLEQGLAEAKRTLSTVRVGGLTLFQGEPSRKVDIKVTPVKRTQGYFLITFDRSSAGEGRFPVETLPQEGGLSREEELERELRGARQQLQAAIEQFETANEEIKSANEELQANNEELQSTNEELESSKEELQSTNEELETANQELQRKNQEAADAEDDARNLFAATDVGTLLLDRNLRIKRFTPAATRMFNLIEKDIGRPIGDITTTLSYERFHEDVRNAIENLDKKEVEVENRNGRWLSVRMLPYRSSRNVIDGVVITFTDVTRLKQAEMEAREAQIAAESIMKAIRQPFLVLDNQLRVRSVNKAFCEEFNVKEKEAAGRSFFELQQGRWGMPGLKGGFEKFLAEGDGEKMEYEYPDAGIMMTAYRVESRDGRPIMILLIFDKSLKKP
jgi:two-component system CheB/CheR fusion protein